MPFLLYAITAQKPRLGGLRGLAGEPLRALEVGAVRAIAGEVAEVPAAAVANLERQDALVRALAERAEALLPARFGTSERSAAALIARLETMEAALSSALEQVRGCEQMTLRVFGEAPTEAEGVASRPGAGRRGAAELRGKAGERGSAKSRGTADLRGAADDIARPRGRKAPATGETPGTAYLLRARERASPPLPELTELRAALAALVRAERVKGAQQPPLRASVFHLVRRGGADAYLRIVDAQPRPEGVRWIASGPFPTYAFAPETLA